MRDAIKRAIDLYATEGVPLGNFLTAVMEHDLFEAFARADEENARDMREIVRYVHNEIPWDCHGSPTAVMVWLHNHRPKPTDAEVVARCEDMLTGPADTKEM